MHDPMTVAFDIPNPFARRYEWGDHWWNRPSLITIWHVDPERHSSDDCNWFNSYRPRTEAQKSLAEALWDMETVLDNKPHYPDSREHKDFQILKKTLRTVLDETKPRRWIHPRWHVWHWKIQVHALQTLKRWLFSRCCRCGKRFPWGYAPVSNSWHSDGARWFKGEKDVFHHECDRQKQEPATVSANASE